MKKIITAIFMVFFLNVAVLHAGSQVYFSPEGGIQKRLIERIEASFESIDIMCYDFTAKQLARSILKARDRGVLVRVLLDSSKIDDRASVFAFLKENGVSIKAISGINNGIMHNKVAIFDKSTVFTGSYNWTNSAEHSNYENGVFSDNESFIEGYSKEFNRLWNMTDEGGRHSRPVKSRQEKHRFFKW